MVEGLCEGWDGGGEGVGGVVVCFCGVLCVLYFCYGFYYV